MRDGTMENGKDYGSIFAMKDTIQMDASGRLVLPKSARERLNLRGGAQLRADVVAGRIELVPVAAPMTIYLDSCIGGSVFHPHGRATWHPDITSRCQSACQCAGAEIAADRNCIRSIRATSKP
jgi:AbrB family looped-hinge helix DNA binding protein